MTAAPTPPGTEVPAPRRIRVDATGWSMLRDAAGMRGLDVQRLPTLGEDAGDERVRERLRATGLLDAEGRPTATVHGALAVLATAPLTLSVERVTRERATQGTWRTLGVPTAGLVVHDERRGGEIHREIELQALTGNHLIDVVLEALGEEGSPETEEASADGDHPDPDELWRADRSIDVPLSGTRGLPEGVLVDGELAARATLSIAGPAGTSLAQLFGDGTRWWQVAATDPAHLRWVEVSHSTVRSALVAAIAAQLQTEGGGDG